MSNTDEYNYIIQKELELDTLKKKLTCPTRCSQGWAEKLSEKDLVLFWRFFELQYLLYGGKLARTRLDLLEDEAEKRGIFFDLLKLYRKFESDLYQQK